jgi:hypothetical protein
MSLSAACLMISVCHPLDPLGRSVLTERRRRSSSPLPRIRVIYGGGQVTLVYDHAYRSTYC